MAGRRSPTQPDAETLDANERQIAGLHLSGETTRQIASKLGLHHSSVAAALKRPHVAEWIEDARRDADAALRRRFAAAGPEAFGVLVEIMRKDEAPETARIAAAKEVLARLAPTRVAVEGGETPVRVAVTDERLRGMSDDELRELRERLGG